MLSYQSQSDCMNKNLTRIPLHVDLKIAIGSALLASSAVTPIVLTIDKAVVLDAAGQMNLLPAIKEGVVNLIRRP